MPVEFAFGHVPAESLERHVELVCLAEELGFTQSWLADQTLFRDPYILLAALAARTESIGLGIGVTNPYTRHPAMTARTIASVAELTGERTILGIGAGNRRELLDPLKLPADKVAKRIKEMVEITRLLWTGEVVRYNGDHYTVDGIGLDFVPPVPVPIYIGGRGRLVLQTAGEVADGAIVGGLCTPAGIGYALDAVGQGAARAGRSIDDLKVVSWVTCILTDDAATDRRLLRPTIAHIIGGAPDDMFTHLDLDLELIARLKELYREGGKELAERVVTDACIDAFAIVGDAAHCIGQIQALSDAGVDQLSVLMARGTADEHEGRLRRMAAEVLPAFAGTDA